MANHYLQSIELLYWFSSFIKDDGRKICLVNHAPNLKDINFLLPGLAYEIFMLRLRMDWSKNSPGKRETIILPTVGLTSHSPGSQV